MTANKKAVIVARAFKDKEGKDHKPGDRIEVDPDYGQELIRRGEARDPEVSQPIADPPKAEPK
jgi:hypothetical protein